MGPFAIVNPRELSRSRNAGFSSVLGICSPFVDSRRFEKKEGVVMSIIPYYIPKQLEAIGFGLSPKPIASSCWGVVLNWTLAIGESCLHEILAFSLDSFLNGRLENATI
jgi:hypothetical protein